MENWLIGTDYEFGLENKNTKVITSAIGLVGGTKDEPIDIGRGCGKQEDCTMVELTQPPTNNFQDFIDYINYGISAIEQELPKYNPVFESVLMYSKKQLKNPKANIFGCASSMNAYSKTCAQPTTPTGNYRSAGFHIHFGHDSLVDNPDNIEKLVYLFDLHITLPSLLIDPDRFRRRIYGKAGEFRFKNYGCEIRTLGAYMMSNFNILSWLWDQLETIISLYESGVDLRKDPLFERPSEDEMSRIEKIINKYDRKKAYHIINERKLNLCYEYSLMAL
jgi:hypothetical protein